MSIIINSDIITTIFTELFNPIGRLVEAVEKQTNVLNKIEGKLDSILQNSKTNNNIISSAIAHQTCQLKKFLQPFVEKFIGTENQSKYQQNKQQIITNVEQDKSIQQNKNKQKVEIENEQLPFESNKFFSQPPKKRQKQHTRFNFNRQSRIKTDKATSFELLLKMDSQINYKERFIQIPLSKICFDDRNQPKLDKWMIQLYQTINQQAFYGFSNELMTQKQTKGFYSKNLLHNFISLIKFVNQKNKSYELTNIFKDFQKISKKILKYQKLKYPQGAKIFINENVNKLIESCSKHEDPENNIVKNAGIKFGFNDKKIYNKQIKQFLNILMKKISESYKDFEKELKCIFVKKDEQEDKTLVGLIMKEMENHNKEHQEYIYHKINTKININVPLFQEKSDKIIIPNSQILRVIIKWIEHLNQKMKNPETHILDRIQPFTGKDQLEINFNNSTKKQIYQRFKSFIKEKNQGKQRNFMVELQNSILDYINNNIRYLPFIHQEQVQIGLAAHILSQQVTKLAINQLNELIHTILQFQQLYKPKEQTNEEKSKKKSKQIIEQKARIKTFYDVNYISFNVFDLMRAQCIGDLDQIEQVYFNLKKSPNFKIIRVKNRLKTSNTDFLINFKYKDTPLICELQLRLKLVGQEQKKQNYTAKFNHFLYQLQRTIYGTLRQSSYVIIQQLQNYSKVKDLLKTQRNQFTKKEKSIQQKQNKQNLLQISEQIIQGQPRALVQSLEVEQLQKNNIKQIDSIYICNNCFQISYDAKFISDNNQICCKCVTEQLMRREKSEVILDKSFKDKLQKVERIYQISYYLLIDKHNKKNKRWIIGGNQFYVDIQQHIDDFFKNLQKITINKLNPDHLFLIFKNKSPVQVIRQSLKTQLKLKSQDFERFLPILQNFRKNIFQELIQNHVKKQKAKEWIENQIHQVNFENWKFQPKQFQCYLKKFQIITNMNMSHNNLKNINFLDDMNIQKKNLSKLQKLNISNNPISTIQVLENFKNIKRLQVSKINLQEFDLRELPQLEYLDVNQNNLSEINVNNFINLKYLNASSNYLSDLDISHNKSLEYLNGKNNKNEYLKIDINEYDPNIQKINYLGVQLKQNFIKVIEKTNIKQLTLQEVKISENELVIQNLKSLKKIEIKQCEIDEKIIIRKNNQIEVINIFNVHNKKKLQVQLIEQLLKLIELRLKFVQLKELQMKKCQHLQQILLQGVKLEDQILIIPELTNLKKLTLSYVTFNLLKIQKNQRLQQIQLYRVELINDIIIIPQLYNLKKLSLSDVTLKQLLLEDYPLLQQMQLNRVEFTDDNLIVSQLPNLKKLRLSFITIKELEIKMHPQLQQIELFRVEISDKILKISLLSNLKKLTLRYVTLDCLEIEKNPQLQEIIFYKILIIPQLLNLKKLRLNYVTLRSLKLQKNSELIQVIIYELKIIDDVLILPELHKLKKLCLSGLALKQLHLQKYPELSEISLNAVEIIEDFEIPELQNLSICEFSNLELQQLNFHNCSELSTVCLSNIQIKDCLSISNLPKLKSFHLKKSRFLKIVIQFCSNLESFSSQSNNNGGCKLDNFTIEDTSKSDFKFEENYSFYQEYQINTFLI